VAPGSDADETPSRAAEPGEALPARLDTLSDDEAGRLPGDGARR
jgi:hypothetical protein